MGTEEENSLLFYLMTDLASFIYLVPCTLLQIVAVPEEVFGCHTEGHHWCGG